MQNEEKYPDRRRDQRRQSERKDHSFEISLLGQDGKTINVSASGVCFELVLKDEEAFSVGKTIPLQINTVTNSPGSQESKQKLSGNGTVIRNWVVENPDRENSLCVALEFTERLNIELNDD